MFFCQREKDNEVLNKKKEQNIAQIKAQDKAWRKIKTNARAAMAKAAEVELEKAKVKAEADPERRRQRELDDIFKECIEQGRLNELFFQDDMSESDAYAYAEAGRCQREKAREALNKKREQNIALREAKAAKAEAEAEAEAKAAKAEAKAQREANAAKAEAEARAAEAEARARAEAKAKAKADTRPKTATPEFKKKIKAFSDACKAKAKAKPFVIRCWNCTRPKNRCRCDNTISTHAHADAYANIGIWTL